MSMEFFSLLNRPQAVDDLQISKVGGDFNMILVSHGNIKDILWIDVRGI